MLPAAQHQGVLPSFFPPELKLPNIATRDIAAVAVRRLMAPPAATEVVYVPIIGGRPPFSRARAIGPGSNPSTA